LFLTGSSNWHGLYSEKIIPPGALDIRLPENHALLSVRAARY
jgi:hypothetical protein